MKKVLSVLFVVLVLALCVLPFSVSAAETTEPGYIYFAVPAEGAVAWKNFNMVFCHMWSKIGGDVYGWQEKAERCEDMGNGYWRYDLSGVTFDPEGEYSLIFSNDIGQQTYNLNITSSCQGDAVYCSGDTCPNPVDGQKTCAVARWMNNGENVHPAIEIDSSGELLNPDEADAETAQTVWGTAEGASYELPEVTVTTDSDTEITDEEDAAEDAELLIAPAPDSAADNADGINTNTATVWIIVVCAVCACAIAVAVILLARKNRKN